MVFSGGILALAVKTCILIMLDNQLAYTIKTNPNNRQIVTAALNPPDECTECISGGCGTALIFI